LPCKHLRARPHFFVEKRRVRVLREKSPAGVLRHFGRLQLVLTDVCSCCHALSQPLQLTWLREHTHTHAHTQAHTNTAGSHCNTDPLSLARARARSRSRSLLVPAPRPALDTCSSTCGAPPVGNHVTMHRQQPQICRAKQRACTGLPSDEPCAARAARVHGRPAGVPSSSGPCLSWLRTCADAVAEGCC